MTLRQNLGSLKSSPIGKQWRQIDAQTYGERSFSKGMLSAECSDAYDWSFELEKIRQKTHYQRQSIRSRDQTSLQQHIQRQHLCDLQRAFQHIEKQRIRTHIRSFSNKCVTVRTRNIRRKARKEGLPGLCPFMKLEDLRAVRADWLGKEGKKLCVTPTNKRGKAGSRRNAKTGRDSIQSFDSSIDKS